ncbi:MAG: LacI family transcriptional regulator [Oligosphaeraceae bacterium]|nr:LacI family transcriptional regulator [Oligosphaeraceae bacterium]
MGRITLKELAALAGVDKSVASKVANGLSAPASAEKISRVQALMHEHGYVPLSAARSLARRRNQRIGFLLSANTSLGFANEVYARMLCGSLAVCQAQGYQCLADSWDFLRLTDLQLPENILGRSVDGFILTGGVSDAMLDAIRSFALPFVAISGERLRGSVPVFSWDTAVISREVLEYCRSLNHRRIWYCTTQRLGRENLERQLASFPDLRVEILSRTDPTSAEALAKTCTRRYCQLPPAERPTFVFGASVFCCALANELSAQGYRCPQDISLLGSHDNTLAQYYHPGLTTISENYSRLGQLAAETLLAMLSGKLNHSQAIQQSQSHTNTHYWSFRASTRAIDV